AYSLTNSLRGKLGCEQVVLGLVRGRHVTPISISGLDDIRQRSPGVVRIRIAMDECLDHGQPIVCQADESWADERLTTGHRLHRQWRDSIGGATVCSIPLRDGEHVAAVVSIRRRADEPFTREQLTQIRDVIEPFAPAFRLLCNARRSLPRHVSDAVSGVLANFVRPGRVARKIVAAAGVLALGWFCFGTMEYVASVPSRVVPAVSRQLAAPLDGRLSRVLVGAGDTVVAGQALCEFATDELLMQAQVHASQIDVLSTEYARAVATDSPVDARLAEANMKLESARLALAQKRIENATVRAPIDGIIVSGDLRKRAGGMLTRGELLFEIAVAGEWKLELDTPQMYASYLEAGFNGRFACDARPEDALPFVVDRVRPSAEVREQTTVFIVDGNLTADADWIRPGMEGLARVDCGPQPVWWVTLHRMIDSMRLSGWL
ncbi:MAG: efflux RND transporter periplasmic adaptor subunit, partial [Phycisphaerae bacterium]